MSGVRPPGGERFAAMRFRPGRRGGAFAALVCAVFLACGGPSGGSRSPDMARAEGRPASAAARDALRGHARWILDRPSPARRLFVEGYAVRTLVAAHAALGRSPADSALARAALARAFAFAETLVATQRESGYWKLGYDTGWVADMGAALGVFAALEPYADSLQLRRWERSAARFAAALERDRLLLPSGAVGVGWPLGNRPERVERAWRSGVGWSDDPYLVATALAGIEVHAWLYRRTGEERYRERALRALDWTLSQLRPDGGLPDFERREGELATAAYVQEGWMAAEALLPADSLGARLCPALGPHVAWLLRAQRADGTWDGGVQGERARTPAIADFLVWYEDRCGKRDDVRSAVGRAAAALVGFETHWGHGMEASAEDLEVLRAMVGRPLAALATGRPVL